MFLLFESIACKNGRLDLLDLHQERVNRSLYELFSVRSHPIQLRKIIGDKKLPAKGKCKIKIQYDKSSYHVSIRRYRSKPFDNIIFQHDDRISYSHKFIDRRIFESAPKRQLRIWVKNGLLTDSDYSNLALLHNRTWYTPAEPLLKGVMRTHLLQTGAVKEKTIRFEDIHKYSHIAFINALNDLDEAPIIETKKILPSALLAHES